MSKMHCFNTKFSKIAKRWGRRAQYWWPKVT